MNKLDYFKLALKEKLYIDKKWILKAFSVTKNTDTSDRPNDLLVKPWGYAINDTDTTKIELSDISEPLFKFSDTITLQVGDLDNITEPVDTTIGRAIFNAIVLVEPFGSKIDYINHPVSLHALDTSIAKRLVSNEVDDNYNVKTIATDDILVSELLVYIQSLDFLSTLTLISSPVVTKKTITPPTGIKEFKAKLLKKYEGKLDDPISIVRFEEELLAFDDAYLKDDPTYGTFLSGKIKNVARKKMFLDLGAEQSFNQSGISELIPTSLNDGWSQDPDEIVSINNGIRVGSYSRGVETVKGGVSAKYLVRSGSSFVIETEDCGTKLGIARHYTKKDIKKLINRYIIQKGSVVQVTDATADSFIGKDIIVRSPGFCILEGDRLCRTCTGGNLNRFPKGLAIPLTEISSIILIASLKKMHGSSSETSTLDITKVLS